MDKNWAKCYILQGLVALLGRFERNLINMQGLVEFVGKNFILRKAMPCVAQGLALLHFWAKFDKSAMPCSTFGKNLIKTQGYILVAFMSKIWEICKAIVLGGTILAKLDKYVGL